MSIIITCGFESVDLSTFRPQSLKKGLKLLESKHVSKVSEQSDPNCNSKLQGTVLGQTPGAFSSKKNIKFYKPFVEVNDRRWVVECFCTCKAGLGYCKHAAALCLFVNQECTTSKTDLPMTFNRPSEAQLEKYRKGVVVESFFSSNSDPRKKAYRFSDVQNVLEDELHMSQSTDFVDMLKAEIEVQSQVAEKSAVILEQERLLKSCIEKLYNLQVHRTLSDEYHLYKAVSNFSDDSVCKLKLRAVKCPADFEKFYTENVAVIPEKWEKICFDSKSQSSSIVWHKERFVRVTASDRAYRIKTRQKSFDTLAKSFKNKNYSGFVSKEMQYGSDLEDDARNFFQSSENLIVHQVGLVICLKQPFLGCSPDGVICKDGEWELLEIKCPFNCKDSRIVDHEKLQTLVPYLQFNENKKLELQKSNKYYTQVQLSLYVLNMKVCNFLVFSKADKIVLRIYKDDDFLADLIPKVEHFYFENLLTEIVNCEL